MTRRLLVVSETRFVRAVDGSIHAPNGVDGYAFWTRYLDAFDAVTVAARTRPGIVGSTATIVDGPGVRVAALPDYVGPWGFWQMRSRLRGALRNAVARADALCVRAPGPIATMAWSCAGGRPVGVEVVGDPLDALAPGAVRSLVRPAARLLMARQLRMLCRDATAVAYVTSGALQRRYPTRGWSTVYSSIDLGEEAFATDEQLRRRLVRAGAPGRGTADDPWRLCFVGSLAQRYKGLDVLLDALGQVRAAGVAVELSVAGEGRHRAELEAQARAAELTVHFVGQQPAGAGVRALLDACDAFVLPSRSEGLPRVLIEAMARGVPCLGTRVGGVPELLDAPDMVVPGDVDALAGAVLALLRRGPLAMGHDGRRHREVARAYARERLEPRRRALYGMLRDACSRRPTVTLLRREARGA
jgi:phosphatidyl-myo-inositol dimannoside synthase